MTQFFTSVTGSGIAGTLTNTRGVVLADAVMVSTANHGVLIDDAAIQRLDVFGSIFANNDGIKMETGATVDSVTVHVDSTVYGSTNGIKAFSFSEVFNHGTITGDDGVDFDEGGVLANHGSIIGELGSAVKLGNGNSSTVVNYGHIILQSPASNEAAIFATGSSGGSTVGLTNFGTIDGGADAGSFNWNRAINLDDAGRVEFVNSGLVLGRVELSDQNDSFVNEGGTIEGNVNLGFGNDFIDLRGGTINGVVDGHFGDDFYLLGAEHNVIDDNFGNNTVQIKDYDINTIDVIEVTGTLDFSALTSGIWLSEHFQGRQVWTRDQFDVTETGTWYEIASLGNFSAPGRFITSQGLDNTRTINAEVVFTDFAEIYRESGVVDDSYNLHFGDGTNDVINFSALEGALWLNVGLDGADAWTTDTDHHNEGTYRRLAEVTGFEQIIGTQFSDYVNLTSANETYVFELQSFFEPDTVETVLMQGGTDKVDFSEYGHAVWVNLGFAGNEVWSRFANDLDPASGTYREIGDLGGVENIGGTQYDDEIFGNSVANRLSGGGGNDKLTGSGGDDIFSIDDIENVDYRVTITDFSANDGEILDLTNVGGDSAFDPNDEVITSFADLVNNHLSDDAVTGNALISWVSGQDASSGNDTFGSVELVGWTSADFGAGLAISDNDILTQDFNFF